MTAACGPQAQLVRAGVARRGCCKNKGVGEVQPDRNRQAEQQLAAFVAGLTWEDLPDDVIERAVWVVIDAVGAIVGGNGTPHMRRLAEALPAGTAWAYGTGRRLEPGYAAFLNGSAGTELELDEGHRHTGGHPGMHVVPACLALAEDRHLSGRDLILALVAGYEAASRTARSVRPLAQGRHPHGTWGVVGAAVAAARLLGLDAAGTLQAMRMAVEFVLNTHYAAAIEGATVRQAYTGWAGMAGIMAARMAATGFTGLEGAVPAGLASLAAGEPNPAALTRDLGSDFEIRHSYFKVHSACRHLHGALDSLDELAATTPLLPEQIEQVQVLTYREAAKFTGARPRNALQARFSLPYAVAARIVYGHAGPAAFADEAITPAVLALAERVQVVEVPEFTAREPAERPTRVEIRLKDGTVLSAGVDVPRGDPERAFGPDELAGKFLSLVAPQRGEANAREALAWLQNLPAAPALEPLGQWLG